MGQEGGHPLVDALALMRSPSLCLPPTCLASTGHSEAEPQGPCWGWGRPPGLSFRLSCTPGPSLFLASPACFISGSIWLLRGGGSTSACLTQSLPLAHRSTCVLPKSKLHGGLVQGADREKQQVWGRLTAQENFPGPHLCSPGSPRHPLASAHPESSALTSARRTELTSLWCGAGDGWEPHIPAPSPPGPTHSWACSSSQDWMTESTGVPSDIIFWSWKFTFLRCPQTKDTSFYVLPTP